MQVALMPWVILDFTLWLDTKIFADAMRREIEFLGLIWILGRRFQSPMLDQLLSLALVDQAH